MAGLSSMLRTKRTVYLAAATVAVVGVSGAALPLVSSLSPELAVHGIASGAVLGATAGRDQTWQVEAGSLDDVRMDLDGRPIAGRREGDRLIVSTSGLAEGRHRLTASVDGDLPMTSASISRDFTVDTTAPSLTVDPVKAQKMNTPVTVRGRAQGATSVQAAGRRTGVGPSGAFTIELPQAPPAFDVVATDKAGNATTMRTIVAVPYPGARAAHITAIGWGAATLREPLLDLARQKKIDTIELDVKDESGEIGYDSQVPLARQIGATKPSYNPRAVLDQLHAMGVRVIGRIVAFRDPVLGAKSWEAGAKNRLVRTPDGGAYDGGHYGKFAFTNFADPEVRKYNIDLAVEAAKLGFDDILYDYVRRPDGRPSQMTFPGIGNRTPEQSIADFVAETRNAIRPHGAFLGVSVFGIAATRPTEIAQDIPLLAKSADYIAPMVYPSHWAAGEYGVASPNSSPYDIVQRSLADFTKQTKGTGASVVPWLQDFSMGVTYGPAEVAAQIKAARDNNMPSFLLWNAGARYQGAALSATP
ncbi:putative glycoside hydrolase [Embleya sp. NPDC005575]|uniref:putative glycoside hydrolase n=1 Tax=Embleya sp. NPDC005575 TaxID=3156892 RepID=UPI0033BEFA9F